MTRSRPMMERSRLRLACLLDRVDQVGQAFEGVVLALHRDDHAVGGAQAVEGEQRQGRRAVDQDEVVFAGVQGEGVAQAVLAAVEADQFDLGAGQVAVGGDQVVVAGLGAHAGFGHGVQADQQVIHRLAEAALVDAAAHGRVALGVEVDEQHALAGGGEAGGEVDAGGRLADAALLVGDAENAGHVRFVSR
jgi:hypothetical protein